jgi:hypothetical protein
MIFGGKVRASNSNTANLSRLMASMQKGQKIIWRS